MAARPTTSEDECKCPICYEFFTDPVVLLCGHSFCAFCLKESWLQSRTQSCPICRKISPTSEPPRNLALGNLSDAVKREQSQAEPEEICTIHGEKLKLFCRDDNEPICVICRDATKHKKHNCVPLSEAAEGYRYKLKLGLMHLEGRLGLSRCRKDHCAKMASHIQLQAQQTEESIKEEFCKIHQLLHEDEAERIQALRKEAALKIKVMETRIRKWSADVLEVKKKVQTIETETENEDLLLIKNLNSTLQSLEHTSPVQEDTSGALIDKDKHLENLQHSIWKTISQTIKYTDVVLDPNTASAELFVSTDLSSTTQSDKTQPCPKNPESLNTCSILS